MSNLPEEPAKVIPMIEVEVEQEQIHKHLNRKNKRNKRVPCGFEMIRSLRTEYATVRGRLF
jgi:hypothetical protein